MFKFNIVAPKLLNLKEEGASLTDTPSQNLLYIQLLVILYHWIVNTKLNNFFKGVFTILNWGQIT